MIENGRWEAREDFTHLSSEELMHQIIDSFVALSLANGSSVEQEVAACAIGMASIIRERSFQPPPGQYN